MAELNRSIGLARATAMVVGIIIGASIFVQPSGVTAQVHSVLGVLLVWVVAGALTLMGSLAIAELSSAFPRTGGVYVFLREAFGPAVGFLWGWAMFWTMHTGIVAVIAMVFAQYASRLVDLGPQGTKALAVGAVIALTALNYRGVRNAASLQVALTVIKVLALVGIVGLATLVAIRGGGALRSMPLDTLFTLPAAGPFALALVAALFAFGGWHMVSYTAAETVDPSRTIPRAILNGTLLVTALYVSVNAAYLFVLPLETVAGSTRVAADFADASLGGAGAQIMSVLVVLSTLGALNGVILAGPRVYLAMATDGVLFPWVGAVHARYRTPHRALVLQGAWASVLVLTGSYRALFTRVVYTEWIFFGMLALALFVFRKRGDYAPPYRAWGYPLLPALFAISSFAIVANQVAHEPADSLIGLGLVLAGLPIYYIWARRTPPAERSPGS